MYPQSKGIGMAANHQKACGCHAAHSFPSGMDGTTGNFAHPLFMSANSFSPHSNGVGEQFRFGTQQVSGVFSQYYHPHHKHEGRPSAACMHTPVRPKMVLHICTRKCSWKKTVKWVGSTAEASEHIPCKAKPSNALTGYAVCSCCITDLSHPLL